MERCGWIMPREDGALAKCGGPAICQRCKQEARRLQGSEPSSYQADMRQLELPIS